MFKKLKETLIGHKDAETNTTTIATSKPDSIAKDSTASTSTNSVTTFKKSSTKRTPRTAAQITQTPKKKEDMELTEAQKASLMGSFVATMKNPPMIGDLVEGPVIAIEKSSVYIDLAPFGTGIIYGREFIVARDIIKKINQGDVIAAKIVDTAHKDGYYELSLKEARQALIWNEAESAIKEKKTLDLLVKEANKGGLMIEWQGIVGF